MRCWKKALQKRPSTSAVVRMAATGTAMAASACEGSMPSATENAVARMAPELASMWLEPPKVPMPSTVSCMLPPMNRPVTGSPMMMPAIMPVNTGWLAVWNQFWPQTTVNAATIDSKTICKGPIMSLLFLPLPWTRRAPAAVYNYM